MDAEAAATHVIQVLHEAGFEAQLVGGCVRDLYLGRTPKDFDVNTEADPIEIQSVFRDYKTVLVGASFGVIIVLVEDQKIEVATYRYDGNYGDGRRPDSVTFTTNVKEDVQRRDFTMNGLMFNDKTCEYVDHVGGIDDIRNKLIRCIGDPFTRFKEDKLRMLRAVRFASQLGFEIEKETFDEIVTNAAGLADVSCERIREELTKIITSPNPVKGLVLLATTGLLEHVWPCKLDFATTLRRFETFPTQDTTLALAMLMLDSEWYELKDICRHFHMANQLADQLIGAVEACATAEVAPLTLGKMRLEARLPGVLPYAIDLLEQQARLKDSKHMVTVQAFRALTPEEINPEPFVKAADLLALGMLPNRSLGALLKMVEYMQLNGDLTSREEALDYCRKEILSEVTK